jgi:hypothetical protein
MGPAYFFSSFTGAGLAKHDRIVTNNCCQLFSSLLAPLSIKERRFRVCAFRLYFFQEYGQNRGTGTTDTLNEASMNIDGLLFCQKEVFLSATFTSLESFLD